MNYYISIFALFFLASCTTGALQENGKVRSPSSSEELSQSHVFWEKTKIGELPYKQRVGMIVEAKGQDLKGCVLYLEGLGDSIQNHYPLFNKLANAGYRVLTFDYLGQGGSEGEMAWTRLNAAGDPFPKSKDYEIGSQAKWVWDKYSQVSDPIYNRTCANSPKMVIGWSTGGLAAYMLAEEKWANAVVLIAPGIAPNLCVGEAGGDSLPKCLVKNISLDHVITLRSLSSNNYSSNFNPHLDPIKPSGFLNIKEFAINLVSTAYLQAQSLKIDPSVKGFVFLSGKKDTYVDRERTHAILQENAPHFTVVPYEGALHEIDNEVPRIANDLHERTIEFFNSVTAGH